MGSSLFGSILSYFLFTFLVYGVSINWVWCLTISSLLNLVIAICFKLKLEDNEPEQYQENFIDFIAFAKDSFGNLNGFLFFIINMLMGP